MAAHRIAKASSKLRRLLNQRARGSVRWRRELPIAVFTKPFLCRPTQRSSGQELANAAEEGLFTRDESRRQILRKDGLIQDRLNVSGCQDGFDFRAEQQPPISDHVVEGFDPQAIPGQQQPLAVSIPEGKGKHASKAPYAGLCLLLV